MWPSWPTYVVVLPEAKANTKEAKYRWRLWVHLNLWIQLCSNLFWTFQFGWANTVSFFLSLFEFHLHYLQLKRALIIHNCPWFAYYFSWLYLDRYPQFNKQQKNNKIWKYFVFLHKTIQHSRQGQILLIPFYI